MKRVDIIYLNQYFLVDNIIPITKFLIFINVVYESATNQTFLCIKETRRIRGMGNSKTVNDNSYLMFIISEKQIVLQSYMW